MALTFGLVSGYREQPSAAADWRCLRSPGIASPRHPWEMKPPSSYPSSSAAQRPLGPPFLPRFTLHSTACNPRTELNSFSTSRPRGAPLPPMTNSFFLSLPFFLCSLEPKLKLVFEKWESSTDTLVTLVSTDSCYRLWWFSRRMTFLLSDNRVNFLVINREIEQLALRIKGHYIWRTLVHLMYNIGRKETKIILYYVLYFETRSPAIWDSCIAGNPEQPTTTPLYHPSESRVKGKPTQGADCEGATTRSRS